MSFQRSLHVSHNIQSCKGTEHTQNNGKFSPHMFTLCRHFAFVAEAILIHRVGSSEACLILLVDFSCAFNTVLSDLTWTKLSSIRSATHVDQQLPPKQNTTQNHGPSALELHRAACFLLCSSLYTKSCMSGDLSVKLINFSDDTTMIGLIQASNESAYREESKQLMVFKQPRTQTQKNC